MLGTSKVLSFNMAMMFVLVDEKNVGQSFFCLFLDDLVATLREKNVFAEA